MGEPHQTRTHLPARAKHEEVACQLLHDPDVACGGPGQTLVEFRFGAWPGQRQ